MSNKQRVITDWYSKYSSSIYRYILMTIRHAHHAEDLTQETFLKAYKYFHSFKWEANPKTWLFSIAHNVTVDFMRKKQPYLYLMEMFPIKAAKGESPDEIVQINESSNELFQAIGRLKKSYREIIILRKIKEFSIKETAEILNWSESKVKSTLSRAIQALEKELLKEGFVYENTI
ncbi:RNA polymerase sigma factor [Oceanobacillus halophilus]|uniref:RNA polymerase sigma factor n=1 Tax=Oceanobacillus halophilus TaxID=930130 RepID=A0A495A312_9BACI|nr:RNA polymerase sigma factor [Oceanobacillus halophilus]RKQ33962.1 RNA polymerase sigma factor [Oceanobacillus halophilus]